MKRSYLILGLVMALLLTFAIPGMAIKILPYANPLHDIMHWDTKSATLVIQNPENENMSVSWPSTVDLWNYNGNSWTFDLPDGDKFAFSKRVDFNISTTEGAGVTVRGISLTDTVGAALAIHEGIRSHITSAYMTGGWTNAIAGVITYSATGSAGGGMAAVFCAEMNMQPAVSSGGSYYAYQSYFNVPTSAELKDTNTDKYAFELYELVGGAKGEFDDYGEMWTITGLTPLVDHVLSADYVTLRITVAPVAGTYYDKFLVLSKSQNMIDFWNTTVDANVADGSGTTINVVGTMSGTSTGHMGGLASWVNIDTATTANVAGTYICAMSSGVWEGAATEIAASKVIFGIRMQKLLTDTPDRACPFSVATSNTGITAIFDVQTRSDLSDDDDDADTYTADGWVPLYVDIGGNIRYIRTYR